MFDFKYTIVRSRKRRSVAILVHPTCEVVVRASYFESEQRLQDLLKQKEKWINSKLNYFKNLKSSIDVPQDRNVFFYLGKSYTIQEIEAKKNRVELMENAILVYTNGKKDNQRVLIEWLAKMATKFFKERTLINFEIFSRQYQYPLPTLKIRRMRSRWGSMSSNGEMTLNLFLMQADVDCIDYVIMHEFCHLKYKSHGKRFYGMHEKLMPDFKERRKRLNETGVKARHTMSQVD